MAKKGKMHFGIMMLLVAMAAGCSSTEVTEPPKGHIEKGKSITLNIGCPEAKHSTRADYDHTLRYTVLVYSGKSIDNNALYERREVLASGGAEETVIFQVPEDFYTFVIIGDYLPKEHTDNPSNGRYPDAYYNTSFDDDKLYMRSFRDFKTNRTIQYNCVNNDNYDCFGQKITIEKTADKYETNVTLKRIVSKINVISSTPAPASISNITFNNLDFYCHYNFSQYMIGTQASSYLNNLSSENISALSSQPNEVLFFFYSFALPPYYAGESLGEINFNLNYEDGSSYTSKIPDRKIKPIANYLITVKGAFMSDPVVEKGDIVLHVSTNSEWDNEDVNVY